MPSIVKKGDVVAILYSHISILIQWTAPQRTVKNALSPTAKCKSRPCVKTINVMASICSSTESGISSNYEVADPRTEEHAGGKETKMI